MRVIIACFTFAVAGLGCSSGGPRDPNALPPPEHGLQVIFGPFTVPFGAEVQLCHTMKLPNEKPIAVNELKLQMGPGSHHFILFRSEKEFPDQTFPCWGTVNFDDWNFVADFNADGGKDWPLLPGQALVLQPHQQIMVQSHFVNASTVQTAGDEGLSYLNLYDSGIDPSQVLHEVHGLFTVDTRISIPPNKNYTTSKMCTPSRSINLVAMTGHFHARGTDFNVAKMNLDILAVDPMVLNPPENTPPDYSNPAVMDPHLYDSGSWNSPLFKIFDPPVRLNASADALLFACSYYNDSTQPPYIMANIGFGGHADVQEHCNLFFQYYTDTEDPNAQPVACGEGSGGW